MEVRIQRSTVIATSPPTTEALELPLTIFDRVAPGRQVAIVFAFSAPAPSNSELIKSLSRTLLLHFPRLSARLSCDPHNPCVILGGSEGGALLVEATVDSNLDDYMPLQPSPEIARLHPDITSASHLLQVQLNRFRCGGLIVGLTAHHRVADGQSMGTFFVAWGKITRGIPLDPIPNYDLSWLKPRFPPKFEFEHWGTDFIPPKHCNKTFLLSQSFVEPHSTSNILIHYSYEFINSKLKAGVKEKFTTFEVLLGHIWRKITIARALGQGETTMIRVPVNGRRRLRPPVSNEFIGNHVLDAYPMSKAGELINGGVGEAAAIIREAVRRIDNRYFQSFIDFGEMNKEENLVPIYDLCGDFLLPHLEADSWLGLQFEDIDFGGGGALCAFLPTWLTTDGLVIFLPRLCENGGVEVFVALLQEHAQILKNISHDMY
ncbi:hypothetical protein KFK09_006183 [Dendrobium nobile]|uniref:Uncharacterized protein n=1 Tax=Dendrobium nobile TaxID=94219 RepID=A0A8T3BSQ4_DENNO|nr:hypothetical protein KFK09_006183 [Dendrobium nobile]